MMIVVSKDGTGDFKTIQAAINSVSETNKEEVKIFIKKGTYKEKISILVPYITLKGEKAEETVITYDDYAKKKIENGTEYRTFNSYTMFVGADNFTAENLTIKNSAGYGKTIGQTIALYVEGDKQRFRNCRIIGTNDTLFTGPAPEDPVDYKEAGSPMEGKEKIIGRQYFEKCYIEGVGDIIFGSATAVFNRCKIYSNNKNADKKGYVTCASTRNGQKYGYVFLDCCLKSAEATDNVYLGRPWRDSAKVVFVDCYMGTHINEKGFDYINRESAEKEGYYAEYNSYGLGGKNLENRIKYEHILDKNEVQIFKLKNILLGEDNWKFSFDKCRK